MICYLYYVLLLNNVMAQHLDQQDIMKSRIANVTVNDGSHFAKVGYGTISHSYVYVIYV